MPTRLRPRHAADQPLVHRSDQPDHHLRTASVTISGILANGDQAPPDTESVQITLDGVTQPAAIGTGGAFSTTFDTSTLGASGSPYTISYSYAGDGTYASASTTGR